jgi:hypothetical protein
MNSLFKLLSGLLLILILSTAQALASTDARMMVDVVANNKKGEHLKELHTNIQHAAKLALPTLWNRIIPRNARNSIPKKVNALLFMQRAVPTENGISISFHDKRVLNYLKSNGLPYIEQEPAWSLSIQLSNAAGKPMAQSASSLHAYADRTAIDWGYKLDETGESLNVQWRWLDRRQVNLTVRGTSRLGEFSETRRLANGDPFPQLERWLTEILLEARDTHAQPLEETAPAPTPDDIPEFIVGSAQQETQPSEFAEQPLPVSQDIYLLLSIERQASLPEQVLFEDDLKRDPRIINLLLQQANKNMRQYRLHLKDSDGQWLVEWFGQRGLELFQTQEGWAAR